MLLGLSRKGAGMNLFVCAGEGTRKKTNLLFAEEYGRGGGYPAGTAHHKVTQDKKSTLWWGCVTLSLIFQVFGS